MRAKVLRSSRYASRCAWKCWSARSGLRVSDMVFQIHRGRVRGERQSPRRTAGSRDTAVGVDGPGVAMARLAAP